MYPAVTFVTGELENISACPTSLSTGVSRSRLSNTREISNV
jgi:hypothetical protein